MVNQVAKSETNSDEHVVLFRKHPIIDVENIGTKKRNGYMQCMIRAENGK